MFSSISRSYTRVLYENLSNCHKTNRISQFKNIRDTRNIRNNLNKIFLSFDENIKLTEINLHLPVTPFKFDKYQYITLYRRTHLLTSNSEESDKFVTRQVTKRDERIVSRNQIETSRRPNSRGTWPRGLRKTEWESERRREKVAHPRAIDSNERGLGRPIKLV